MKATTDLISPLRYPGSKYILADYFERTIHENLFTGCHFYEPYAGGASMSLCLLGREAISRATLVERDPLVYSFWKCVQTQPDALCERITRLRVSVATWKRFQCYLSPNARSEYDLLDLGVAGLFFNRANFSGIINAKPIGGMSQASQYTIDCRFNKERLIDQIQQVAKLRRRFSVHFGDAVKYLRRRQEKIAGEHSFVYVDPPYLKQGRKLYRYFYRLEQHRGLAEFLNPAPFKWMVSYDNHPFIHELFQNQRIVPIFLSYAVKQSRKAEELLIANFPLAQPSYEDYYGTSYEPMEEDLTNVAPGRRLRICG